MKILEKLKTPLKITDVDFRIQSINKAGYATILPYKDARVDMNRLDEVCGTNWQKDYKTIDGSLYCGIGIKIDNEWLWRWDVGTESFSEKEKGKASDAFKRSGFCWGIGRELYDYPLIQVKLREEEFSIKKSEKGKEIGQATWKLKLKEWKWSVEFDNGQVTKLIGTDEKGVARYNYDVNKSNTYRPTPTQKTTSKTSQKEKEWLNKVDAEKNFTKEWLNVIEAINDGKITSVDQVREHYKVSKSLAEEIQNAINLKPQTVQ